ncbi:branched-chain amino acid ABC transporter permease [Microbacterium kyungheense]|uniref:Amino acid/amide ABC transporter membrane protein 2 (HAAT family) n=1 Tax=Microbacterium kyungheense TaxID=1263636 RepID=A0A543FKW2_9MICO|nr:branched-chain amino acid ABC transporter permease [Microbacterium kyungheense]TQM34314.1 amino acid/amide ABC transporter membrane protein 2 (HAAT family) [Microbacterium kyungheense]
MTARTTLRRGIPRTLALGALLTLLAIGGTFLLDPYRNFQLATVAAYFCATAGLTVLIGRSGQLSLGQAALMAAGGYGYALTANAMTDAGATGIPRFLVSLLAAMATAGVLGWLLGLAAARLRGPYLAGVTLALVIAVPAVAAVFSGVLRGDQGVQIAYDGMPPLLERLIAVEQWQAWVAILVAGVVVTGLAVYASGRTGLRVRAVRDDETAARLNGVRPGRVKVGAFTVSSVAAGAGGAVLCFVSQSVSPGAYTLAFSLLLVVAVVLGGLGSIGGAAIGSALIVLLPWVLGVAADALPLPADVQQRLSGNLSILVFGLLLIVVTLLRPGGLASLRPHRARRNSAATDARRVDDPPDPHGSARARTPRSSQGPAVEPVAQPTEPGKTGERGEPGGGGAQHPEPALEPARSAPPTPHRKR